MIYGDESPEWKKWDAPYYPLERIDLEQYRQQMTELLTADGGFPSRLAITIRDGEYHRNRLLLLGTSTVAMDGSRNRHLQTGVLERRIRHGRTKTLDRSSLRTDATRADWVGNVVG